MIAALIKLGLLFLAPVVETITITGYVIHDVTGEGVPGVTIHVRWLGDWDENGTVDLHDVYVLQSREYTPDEWYLTRSQLLGPLVSLERLNDGTDRST